MKEKYKFERFRDQEFPVYSSLQKGNGVLVVPHFHKAAELNIVQSGKVTVNIQAQSFTCHKGDIFLIPPFCVHNVICASDFAEICGLTFELSLIPEGAFDLSVEKILNKEAITEYIFKDNCANDLELLMADAVDIYSRCEPTFKLEMLSVLFRITAALIKRYFKNYEAYENFDRLQPVIDYIGKHYPKELTLFDLSRIISVCDDHLIRLFKSATNKTPIRYIMDLRLQEAMKLLLNTNLSITEIAYQVGFSGANYMTRIFRSRLKMTPSQYRKENKRENV